MLENVRNGDSGVIIPASSLRVQSKTIFDLKSHPIVQLLIKI